MFARTALSAAVTVALVSAPATLGVPVFGSAAHSEVNALGTAHSSPAPTAAESHGPPASPRPTETPHTDPSPDDDETHEAEDDESDEEATLPDDTYNVRKSRSIDTFALYRGAADRPFRPDSPLENMSTTADAQSEDRIIVPLPDPESGEDRDFVLDTRSGALNLVTANGDIRFNPEAEGEGDRTFTFDVTDGAVGDVNETTPEDDEPSEDPSPSPTDEPSRSPEPSPTVVPTPDPSEDPDPSPTDPDDGDDREDEGTDDGGSGGADDDGSDDDGSGSDERDDEGLTEDPSTGNGSDDGGREDPREAAPSGNDDWVPTGPQRPDYSDPVPQPPGAGEDDAITADDEASTQPADGGDGDGSDDVATDSASEDGTGAGIPWQIGVVVAIGAAAIGFILFVAGRRRKD